MSNENATTGGRRAFNCLNARRFKRPLELLSSLGIGWGIQPGDEYDGDFTAVNEFTGERICRHGFVNFDKAIAARCASGLRAKITTSPRPRPKARPRATVQARPGTYRPRMSCEIEAELVPHLMDVLQERLDRHKVDVRRDGLSLYPGF